MKDLGITGRIQLFQYTMHDISSQEVYQDAFVLLFAT